MKNTTPLVQLQISLFVFLITFSLQAQIGVGTTTPAGGSILDITSANKGILVPRVNIADLGTIAPVTGGATVGLLVWNNNVGTGVGYHYWDGDDWIPLSGGGSANDDWKLAGNTLTGTEFLGSTSTHDLNFRTDNTHRMRVQSNGQVTINYAGAGNAGQQLNVVGTSINDDAMAGYSGGLGTGVYGQHVSIVGTNGNGNAIFGFADADVNSVAVRGTNNGLGIGMRAENFFSTNYSLHAIDGTTSVYGANTFGLIGVSGTHFGDGVTTPAGIGVRGENFLGTNYSVLGFDGFYSVFGDNNIGGDGVVGQTDSTVSNGIWGLNDNAAGTGILGGQNNLYVYPTGGTGVAGSGSTLGVYGYAGEGNRITANRGNAAGQFNLDTDSDPTTNNGSGGPNPHSGDRANAILAGFDNVSPNGTFGALDSYFGGYFSGGNVNSGIPSYAYAGIRYNTNNAATTGTNYKIIGNGTNSTIIRDSNDTPRILFSPEAPEILFEDYGTGTLDNGVAHISLDRIFSDAIHVDKQHPLKVFIQLEGDCNGVYVTNKSANGFTVKELQNGQSNVPFSWHVVANRADSKDENGNISSKHVGLRFPIGPGPLQPTPKASKEVKDPSQITVNPRAKAKELPAEIANRIKEKNKKTNGKPGKDISINKNIISKPDTDSSSTKKNEPQTNNHSKKEKSDQ